MRLLHRNPALLGTLAPVLPIVLLPVAVWVVLVHTFWPFTLDDSFITLRYAQNLASGHGPTFNPGQHPTEGYSTFLWMLLMALPHLLRLDAVTFAKVAGVLSTLASFVVSFLFARRRTRLLTGWPRYVPAATVILMLGTLPATSIHAVSGMETAFFTLTLTAFLACVTRQGPHADPGTPRWCSLLGLLVGLTRPEGNLVVVVALLAAALRTPRPRRAAFLGTSTIAYLLPAAVYMAWRWTYYGHPFPLAYYVKFTSTSPVPGLKDVVDFLRFFGARLGPFVLLGLLGMRRDLLPALLGAGALIAFFILPNHWMAYDWRYLFPIVPFLCVLAASGFATLQTWMVRPSPIPTRLGRGVYIVVLLGLYLGGLGWIPSEFLRGVTGDIEDKAQYARTAEKVHFAIGKQLASLGPLTPTPLLAVADAGAIPYYSCWRTIDTFGLNDATIALSGRHDPEYVLAQKPDLVLLNSWNGTEFVPRMPWSKDLYDACLREGMAKIQVSQSRENNYCVWLMGNSENPVVQRFLQAISQTGGPILVLDVRCASCKRELQVQANLEEGVSAMKEYLPFPANDRLTCPHCGAPVKLSLVRQEVEFRYKKRILSPVTP